MFNCNLSAVVTWLVRRDWTQSQQVKVDEKKFILQTEKEKKRQKWQLVGQCGVS